MADFEFVVLSRFFAPHLLYPRISPKRVGVFVGKMLLLLFFGLLPSKAKVFLLRRRGHRVGMNVYIGPVVLDVQELDLGDSVSIRGLNLFKNVRRLEMGDGARIGGWGNWFTGSGAFDNADEGWGVIRIGAGSDITSRHYFDLQDSIEIGEQTLIAGAGSVFYTHGMTPDTTSFSAPLAIGSRCYVGSHCMMLPTSRIGDSSFVAARAVVTKDYSDTPNALIAGNPAEVKKTYDADRPFFILDHDSYIPAGASRRRDLRGHRRRPPTGGVD